MSLLMPEDHRHRCLISSPRGFFHLPGDPGTPKSRRIRETRKSRKPRFFRLESCNGQDHPEPAKSTSLSKNPVFWTDVLCFIILMWPK